MKQAPERSPLREELIAPRQFLFRQLKPAVMVITPGGRHLDAYHEHKCPICGNITGGVGNSLCPKTHTQQELILFWAEHHTNNTLTKCSSPI